ncbi:MAG TPA: LamG-like jellyroll fold domain-containing protein [Gemmataceae bacterium]|jgi:hypothetical protein
MDTDLHDLLVIWQDGEDPGPVRRAALLARLGNDEAFRRAFLDDIRLLGMLKVVQSPEPRWLRLEDELGWSRQEPSTPDALADRVMQSVRASQRRRWLVGRVLAVAAIVALVAGIALLRPGKPKPPDAPRPGEQSARLELATVIELEGVEWTPESVPLKQGSIVRTGWLHFDSGRLTLAFFTGVALTVEGPADLELRTPERVFCQRGKLRARVPPGAEGFTVLASGCEVIDQGTEFGLNLEPDGKANLMVFEGEVALSVVDPSGRRVHSAVVEEPMAVEVQPDMARIQEVDMPADHFVRLPPILAPVLELTPSYRDEVLASNPWGYWRFERLEGKLVPNEVAGRPALRAEGNIHLEGAPGGNCWAVFPPGDSEQSLLMEGEWSLPHAQGYALEMWVQPSLPTPKLTAQAALVSLIARGDDPTEKHVSYLALTARSRRSLHEPCQVRFLDRWPADVKGGDSIFSERTFVPALWHHIVAQKVGIWLQLYIDGQLARALRFPARGGDAAESCKLLVGQLKRWPLRGERDQRRPFGGRLDELAVYGQPLSAEEIQRHFKCRILQGQKIP